MRRIAAICLVLIGVLLLGTVGCGLTRLFGGGDEEGEVATTVAVGGEASAGVTPPAAPAASADEETLPDLSPVDALQSYRSETLMTSMVDDAVTESWTLLIEYVKEPPAQRTLSTDADGSTYEMIQIGNDTYVSSGDEWIAVSGSEGMDYLFPAGLGFSAEDLQSKGCAARGRETVSGYASVHYVCEADEGLAALSALGGVVQNLASEVWVSDAHNVAVRSLYTHSIKGTDGKVSSTRQEVNVTAINEPITITPPEGVAAPGLGTDIPVMDGAVDILSLRDMTTFGVPGKTPTEVGDWYRETLTSAGWAYDESSIEGEVLRFSKGDRQVTIGLSATSDGSDVFINSLTE